MAAGNATEYSIVLATVGLASLEQEAIRLSRTLQADGTTAQASLVRQAYIKLLSDLDKIAVVISQVAEKEIKKEEVVTRVRPDTGGQGGPRLGDFIGESHPLKGVEGSVGINHEPTLDANGVDWWFTNEEGYSGHVGREVHGFFQPGRSRPGAAPPRTHPLFQPTGPKGPKMEITEPIPERKFVRSGAAVAERDWHGQVRRAKRDFIRSCEIAVAQSNAIKRSRAGVDPAGRRRRTR